MARRTSDIVERVQVRRHERTSTRLVKSAARVLQIIEFFDSIKGGSSEAAIAGSLDIPQSSMAALLRTMVAMGYVEFDRHSRIYSLGRRAALLGSWIDPDLVRAGPIVELMNAICDRIGKNVVLISKCDQTVRIDHVVQPAGRGNTYVSVSLGPLLMESTAGLTLLSQMSEQAIRILVRRYNADLDPGRQAIDVRDVLTSVERVRSDGAVLRVNATPEEGWVLAVPLPPYSETGPLAIGVGDFSTVLDIDPDETIAIIKQMISNWRRY